MLLAMLHGPLGDGLGAVTGTDTQVFQWVQALLGPIAVVLGGGRAAWNAAHGRDFSGELITAIAGACLIGASGWSGLQAQTNVAAAETKSAAQVVGTALGGIVTVVGGSWAAWKVAHGERATGHIVCAIFGVCIAAVSVIR